MDSPSTLMTPSRCSILMTPQHSRTMAMVCQLLSLCSSSILMTPSLNLNLGNFDFSNKLNLNVQACFSASFSQQFPVAVSSSSCIVRSALSCLSRSLPFYPPSVQLSGVFFTQYSDLCSILLSPPKINSVLHPVGQSLCPSLCGNRDFARGSNLSADKLCDCVCVIN